MRGPEQLFTVLAVNPERANTITQFDFGFPDVGSSYDDGRLSNCRDFYGGHSDEYECRLRPEGRPVPA